MPRTDWLAHLLHENRVVELRYPAGDRWHSGLFDDLGALRRAASELNGGNLFASLNRPGAHVIAGNTFGAKALTDADVALHTHLALDFDPVRPTGTPSTEAELQAAIAARNRQVSTLQGLGWPPPAFAISGNGAHAVYRVRLPANSETRDMLAALYRGFAIDGSTEAVKLDPTTRNPARIWRVYGSTNAKGTATHTRPHRVALVTIPARWEAISPRQVANLAEHYARRQAQTRFEIANVRPRIDGLGDYSTLDVVSWFAAHGALGRPLGGGKHSVMCPWAHEHSSAPSALDTSSVVWEAREGRWPVYHCSHSHCDGRRINDVRELWGDADAHCARAWAPV